jgi:hypothetical protein
MTRRRKRMKTRRQPSRPMVTEVMFQSSMFPTLATTLISVSHLASCSHLAWFAGPVALITHLETNSIIGVVWTTEGGFYYFNTFPILSAKYAHIASSCYADVNVLHHHLGHLDFDNVKCLVAKGMVEGVDSVGGQQEFCKPCVSGKLH